VNSYPLFLFCNIRYFNFSRGVFEKTANI
jgi:hypothetical protein